MKLIQISRKFLYLKISKNYNQIKNFNNFLFNKLHSFNHFNMVAIHIINIREVESIGEAIMDGVEVIILIGNNHHLLHIFKDLDRDKIPSLDQFLMVMEVLVVALVIIKLHLQDGVEMIMETKRDGEEWVNVEAGKEEKRMKGEDTEAVDLHLVLLLVHLHHPPKAADLVLTQIKISQ